MRKYIFITCLFFIGFGKIDAQTANQFNSWWTYSGNHKVTQKISLHTLYSLRRSDFVKDWQQSLLRFGLNYHYSGNLILSGGYDWVVTYPYGEQPIGENTTEQRIYEQIVLKNKISTVGIMHRYRVEQRFSNQTIKHRIRYRLGTTIPLITLDDGKQKLFLSVFDELFVNFGSKAKGHYFDQNWFYAGLGFQLKNGLTIKMGYMNQYILKGDNAHIENNHTPQFGLSYNLNLQKHS